MTPHWRVIDLIDHAGEIESRRGGLVISGVEVPLDDVSCIITGLGTRWHGGVVALASKYGVPIVACDWRGVPISVLMPWSTNTRVAARQYAQAEMTLPRKKNAWMRIVRSKIIGQAANLAHQPKAKAQLDEHARAVRSGDPDNREARAARTYWSNLFPGETFTRDADAPGRNALLNYGYAIIRGVVVRSIVTAGLSPTLGIWHHNRSNAFGLADDLIEPFRPAIDFVAAALPADASVLDREIKHVIVGALEQPMAGSGSTVATSINQLAQQFAHYTENEVPVLTVPVWTPPRG